MQTNSCVFGVNRTIEEISTSPHPFFEEKKYTEQFKNENGRHGGIPS